MSDRRRSINDIQLPPDMVKGHSLSVLKEINKQDEGSFFEFFQGLDLEEVKKTQQRREEMQEENRELAIKTCDLQPQFDDLKSKLRQKSTEVDELRESYVSKYEELKEFQKRRDNNSVKSQLVQAVKNAENSSEDMASDFVAGKSDLSVDDFKDKFLELRSTYWMRKVKNEKLDELLKNQRPTPVPRVPRTQPQPQVPSNPAQSLPLPPHMAGQAPYPVEPRRPSEPMPTASLPPRAPYAVQPNVSMPRPPPPGHPFSSIPPSYHPQQTGYPVRPPVRPPPYASYAHGHRY